MARLNVVVLGGFPYPHGMAGTKKIQHVIDGIKHARDVSVQVIVLRQSSNENRLEGIHKGVPYQTVMGDVLRMKLVAAFPYFCIKSRHAVKSAYQPDATNILFCYGPPTLDNTPLLGYARRMGFKILFYIVEDYDVSMKNSRSPFHWTKNLATRGLLKRIQESAAGILVISSHLWQKFADRTAGRVPMHYLPISIDPADYPENPTSFTEPFTLFYSGSFGKKDGIFVLLDAFERLAACHENVRFVLTGRGSDEAMKPFFRRVDASLYKERIQYKGYLDDSSYYAELNASDIPCMTREGSPYAHAGFPFKLGEFLATGKPVVASRVSDVESFLSDRHNAMLVAPSNAVEIADALEYLISHPDSARGIGKRGRQTALQHFDYHRQGEELLAFMRHVTCHQLHAQSRVP